MTFLSTVLDRTLRMGVALALLLSSMPPLTPPRVASAGSVSTPTASATPVTALPFVSPVSTPSPTLTPTATLPPLSTPAPTATPLPPVTPVSETLALTPTQAILGLAGGRLRSLDGRIQLDVPPGLLARSTRLSITPRAIQPASDPQGMLRRFDLEAQDLVNAEMLAVFTQPLTLTIDLRGLATWDTTPPGTRLTIMTNISDTWVEAPGVGMPEYGLLIVPIQHFSQWASGYMANQWKMTYNAPVVSTFSGAATYDYPIEIPAGRNGFTPKINLSYNSRRVDGLLEPGWNSQPPLGMGWSIDTLDVVRDDIHGLSWSNWFGDEYSLAINGTSYHLLPDVAGQNNGFYRAKDAPWLLARRINDCTDDGDCTNHGGVSAPNFSGEYWLVWLGDGTVARVGYAANAEQRQVSQAAYCPEYCGYGPAYRWRVDVMTDTLGNTLRFTYYEDESTADEPLIGRSRISKIEYNNSTVPGSASPQYTSYVEFNAAAGLPGYLGANYINQIKVYNAGAVVREYRLTLSGEYGDAEPDICGQYVAMEEVKQIQQYDANGNALPATLFTYGIQRHAHTTGQCANYWYLTGVSNGYGAATTFSYLSDARWLGCWPQPTWINGTLTCNNPDSVGLSYRVAQATTNDGLAHAANVQYEYGPRCYDQWSGNTAGGSLCRGDGQIGATGPLVGHQTVTEKVYDYGGALLTTLIHTYDVTDNNGPYRGRELTRGTYQGTALVTQASSTYATLTFGSGVTFAYLQQADTTTYSGTVTATQRTRYEHDAYGNQIRQYDDGSTATTSDDHTTQNFYNANTAALFAPGTQLWPRNSPPEVLSSSSPAANAVDGNSSTAWNSSVHHGSMGMFTEWINVWLTATHPVDFVYLDASASGALGMPISFTVSYYTGQQWTPVLTYTNFFAETGVVTLRLPTRVTTNGIRIYATQLQKDEFGDSRLGFNEIQLGQDAAVAAGTWIVNKPARTNVCSGSVSSPCGSGAQWRALNYYDGVMDTTMAPTRGVLTGNALGAEGQGYVTKTMQYDAWGNPIVVTDTLLRPMTTTYETAYNLYPVQVKNAKNQTVQVGYNFTLGVPMTVTDIDGSVTTLTYDGFGRALEVYRPLDVAGDPATRYVYRDIGSPQWLTPTAIIEWHKPASLGVAVRHFYDGLGREIQTHTAYSVTLSGDSTPRDIVVSQRYDARGLIVSQTVPYTVTAYAAYPANPYTTTHAATAPKTLTQYDALGRATVITAPDGTVTTHAYLLDTTTGSGYTPTGLWLHAVVDANQHGWHYVSDAFNQLTVARELSGTVAPRPLYAETKYQYDVLGQLRRVTDTLTNTTVMTYNVWGQKTEMADPDMGQWKYQYDAGGNLKVQDDASHQRTCFYYDRLNRPIGKYYTRDSSACATGNPPLVVTYSYDGSGSGPGVGQRTGMSDPSGSASWAYDTRGRVVAATHAITVNGTANVFTTGYGYDLLDRVLTTTYPTGEVVTQTYNTLGALENVRSQTNNQWYASNLDYTANGSLARLDLGNTLSTTYTYWPLNFRLKQLLTGGASGTWQDLSYRYDNVGNVLTITDTRSFTTTQYQTFKYDPFDRLITATVTGGRGTYSETYAYDALGNLKSNSRLGAYTYPASGLNSVRPHAASGAGVSNTYQYNVVGNMITRTEGAVVYAQAWDVENRLSVVTNTGTLSVTRFVYDGDGARVVQIKPDGSRVAYVGGLLEVEFRLPVTPTNLSIGSVSDVQINLTWVDASNNEGGFKLERSTGGVWTEIATLAANLTTYSNGGLTCNTAYTYRVRAYNSAGNSNYSNTATATTATCATPPAAPGNLSGYASATEAALSWADNSGNEDGFKVERGTYWQGTVYWSEVALVGTNVTAYLDTGLESDTTYAYRVRAYNALGDSGYSNTIYVYTDGGSMMAAGLAASPLALTGQSSVPAGQIWKSYYRAGSQLIALRVDGDPITATNGLFFLHTDHLGSASLTTNATGGLIARQLYDAWGNVRTDTISGTMPTDIGYTGQYLDKATGNLVFLNARYYLPASGRFISADTIVPGAADGSSGGAGTLGYDSHTRLTPLTTDFHEFIAQVSSEHAEVLQFGPFFMWSDKVRKEHNVPMGPLNPQALNRYSYVLNNPLRYVDPTGHDASGVEFKITFYNLELIKYFISAIREEAKYLRWRGQQLSNAMTVVSWAGGGILAPGAIAAKVGWGAFGLGTAGTLEGLIIGGPGGGDVAAQLDRVADILFQDLAKGSSLIVTIGSGESVAGMTIDTGKQKIYLNCVTQCVAAQMEYLFNAMLQDRVAWKYNMLSVTVNYAFLDPTNNKQ